MRYGRQRVPSGLIFYNYKRSLTSFRGLGKKLKILSNETNLISMAMCLFA